jgi:plastocyanin
MFGDSRLSGLHRILKTFRTSTGEKSKRRSQRFRPWVESLESRTTPSTTIVHVQDDVFSPQDVTIATGDTVQWKWDAGPHSTTSAAANGTPNGLWDSGILGVGSTFEHTFNTVGDFFYICTVHFACCGMSGTVHVTAPASDTLKLTGLPSSVTAGVSSTFTVTAENSSGSVDTGYTGTVHFTSSDAKATLPANYTFTAADAGVHTFSTTLKTAGSRSVTATDTVNATVAGTQSGITVNPAAAKSFSLTGLPASTKAGVVLTVTVTAQDAFGNTATGYRGTIDFTSSDAKATLPANYTFTVADSGVHTFTNGVVLKTAGVQSVTATDTVNSNITGKKSGVTVTPAAATSLVVAGFPSTSVAGTSHSISVTAKDAYGNVATGYTGMVHFTSSDTNPTTVLPANYTFTSANAGVKSFSIKLTLVGSQSITATDAVTASVTGSQSGISITPAVATKLTIGGLPGSTVAGVVRNFTLTAKDAFNNIATAYRGTVHFTSNDPQAVLSADYTFTAADAGVHTFKATLKTAGSAQSVTSKGIAGPAISTTRTLAVTPATASVLVITGPSSPTHNVMASYTVTARDAYGNVATGYRGTIHFTSSDGSATLPANYTFVSGDSGVHTFNVTFQGTGAQSLTATDTVKSSIKGSVSVTVASLPANNVADYDDDSSLPAASDLEKVVELLAADTRPAAAGDVVETVFADDWQSSAEPMSDSEPAQAVVATIAGALLFPRRRRRPQWPAPM